MLQLPHRLRLWLPLLGLPLTLALSLLIALPSHALERRCGWLDNPTPANWWLQDAQASWTISAQGGFQAQGMENIPDISEWQYVKTNGNYGYACACMDVRTDKQRRRILSLRNFKQLPLQQCRRDPALPRR
jgi:hypothetical protein